MACKISMESAAELRLWLGYLDTNKKGVLRTGHVGILKLCLLSRLSSPMYDILRGCSPLGVLLLPGAGRIAPRHLVKCEFLRSALVNISTWAVGANAARSPSFLSIAKKWCWCCLLLDALLLELPWPWRGAGRCCPAHAVR